MIGSILRVRYELVSLIQEGPIFFLYEGKDRLHGKEVSIRLFRSPYKSEVPFLEATRTAAKRSQIVQHPGVERIDDLEMDGDVPFLVGQFSPGTSLTERVRKLAPFSVPVAVGQGVSILEGLAALHGSGIIHGDLSTDNIVHGNDGSARIQLAGMWKAYSSSETAGRDVLPSMATYLAPEIGSGAMPSAQSDVYAVGVIMYLLLCGRYPYSADNTVAMAIQHATAPTPSVRTYLPAAPMVLDEIIKKAMHKDPEMRYANASQMLSDLRMQQDALRFGRTLSWPLRRHPAGELQGTGKNPLQNKVPNTLGAQKGPMNGNSQISGLQNKPQSSSASAKSPTSSSPQSFGTSGNKQIGNSGQSASGGTNVRPQGYGTGNSGSGNTVSNVPSAFAPTGNRKIAGSQEKENQVQNSPRRRKADDTKDVPTWLVITISVLCGAVIAIFLGFWLISNVTKPKMVVIPNLQGKDFGQAKELLATMKIHLKLDGEQADSHEPDQAIIESDPPAGDTIREGGTVNVVVSSGGAKVTAPDLHGMTIDAATTVLKNLSLGLSQPVIKAHSDTVAEGLILTQNPEPNKTISKNTMISISVSSGPDTPSSSTVPTAPSTTPSANPSAGDQTTKPTTNPPSDTKITGTDAKTYNLNISLNDVNHAVMLRVDMTDDNGTQTILTEAHEAGDKVPLSAQGTGKTVTFRIYYDDNLVKTVVKSNR